MAGTFIMSVKTQAGFAFMHRIYRISITGSNVMKPYYTAMKRAYAGAAAGKSGCFLMFVKTAAK